MATAVLGVSGSVAAYRAADLARELMRSGFQVRVCLTDSAQKFVSTALFEALTGQPCLVDTFEEPVKGRMAHIDWARAADVLVVAPATANTLSRLAHGIGDDMLTTIAIAYGGPVVVAPAMNPTMYASDGVRASLKVLRGRGVEVVEPTEGDVACGENGQGKLAPITKIAEAATVVATQKQLLAGKVVLITSGPTIEAIDDVRFISNHSSGKMGAALARAALTLGARVIVVSGPTSVELPEAAQVIRVNSALEMLNAASPLASQANFIIGCAAVADYRAADRHSGKLRRSLDPIHLDLVPNPDIIAELAKSSAGRVVGFAAEPSSDLETARAKLSRKGLFAIASNDVSRTDIGFDADDNELTLVFSDGRTVASGKQSKLKCAFWLLGEILGP